MSLQSSLRFRIIRVLAIIVLIVLLSGCGGGSGSQISGSTSSVSNTPTSTDTPTPVPTDTPTPIPTDTPTPTDTPVNSARTQNASSLPLNSAVSINTDGLSIQSYNGHAIGCAPDFMSISPNALVLAQLSQQYDVGTIQQIQDYVNGLVNASTAFNATPYPAVPTTLQQAPGSLIGHIDGWNMDDTSIGCIGRLVITNTGTTAVQLSQVSAQLTAVPQQNSTQYSLINMCMQGTKLYKAGPPTCPSRPSASNPIYQADFTLGMGDTNTEFQARVHPKQEDTVLTNGITLQPKDTIYLDLNFMSSNNLIYSVVPQFSIDVAGEQRQIVLPTHALAFARAQQFSCYDLQGTSFVSLQQVITMDPNQAAYDNMWCL